MTGLKSNLGLVIYRGREVVQLDRCVWAIPDALILGAGVSNEGLTV